MLRLRKPLSTAVSVIALALLAGCGHQGPKQPDANVGTVDDWAGVGGGNDEAQYSKLTEIDTGSVGKLGLAWALDLPGEVTLEATPLEVEGTIFFTGSYAKAYAVDAATGKLKWSFDPETWKHNPAAMHFSFGANRGMAYENGRVFFAGLDGRLFGLDARTGKQLWVTDTIPKGAYNISTGAPRVMNGKVIIGNGGADFGARGFVTAVDAATGKLAWKFYTTPGKPGDNNGQPELEKAAATWGPNHLKAGGGGGTVWNGMTFDPARNRIYIGVGNAGPYDPQVRDPGGNDNLFTSSIVALDANTGKYIWHYQENPRDSWDYKATPNIVTATLNLDGRPRDVILHAPTNGFLYVIDRESGKVISAGAASFQTWAKGIDLTSGRPVENPNIRYETGLTKLWPGTVGGHNWQPMSYSPRTGLVYIPQQQIGARFSRHGGSEDAFNVMGLTLEPIVEKPGDGHGYLVAWDPVAQKQVWRVQHKGLWNGGTMATAGNLVFQGTADGFFKAYDAKNGKELWSFNAGLGIIGAPISYRLNGKQYVSILVGYGGTAAAYGKYMDMGWKFGAQPRRLLTFALDGRATLPASSPATFKVNALDDPELQLNEADVAAGKGLSIQCAACHGVGLHATGTPGPDLRESAIALKLDTFRQLLKSGALMDQGMPRFETLTDDQIRQLHAYIRAKARESLGKRAVDASSPMPKL